MTDLLTESTINLENWKLYLASSPSILDQSCRSPEAISPYAMAPHRYTTAVIRNTTCHSEWVFEEERGTLSK